MAPDTIETLTVVTGVRVVEGIHYCDSECGAASLGVCPPPAAKGWVSPGAFGGLDSRSSREFPAPQAISGSLDSTKTVVRVVVS